MSVEELKVRFRRLAEPVVAMEDPYGRLLRRARRTRRVRLARWGSGLAAAVAAAVLIPLLATTPGAPSPAPSPGVDDLRGTDITPWVRQLLDSPARGSLGTDTAFARALTGALAPRYFGLSPELDQRTVLFAGDVGGYRAVLIAFQSRTRQMGVWLIGDAGASAARLAAAGPANLAMLHGSATPPAGNANQVTVLMEELQPFTATGVNDEPDGRHLAVGVAPAGCRLATKDATHPQTWHEEATGDYVLRTDPLAVDFSTRVQVTCAGVVRYAGPIIDNGQVAVRSVVPNDRQIDAAMLGARGTPADRTAVRNAMAGMPAAPGQPPSFDGCKVLYHGSVPGAADSSPIPGGTVRRPPVLVVACPTAHGNTFIEVDDADNNGGGEGGYTRVRLDDPRAVFAVHGLVTTETSTTRSDGTTTHGGGVTSDDLMLVVGPPSATDLQVVQGGQVIESVPLAAGIGSMTVPGNGTVQLRALDGSGAVVGSATAVPTGEDIPEEQPAVTDPPIDNWK
jgi:hypothetical protein